MKFTPPSSVIPVHNPLLGFGLVKVQYIRVIKVAVKEMLPAFHLESVINAYIMYVVSHAHP